MKAAPMENSDIRLEEACLIEAKFVENCIRRDPFFGKDSCAMRPER